MFCNPLLNKIFKRGDKMNTTINLNDLKKFIKTVNPDEDEWYGPQNYMTGSCIHDFLEWKGEQALADEFYKFLQDL